MKPNLIAQGAEAKIIQEGAYIIKDRISKGYRHPELDKKIIKQRTKKETKLLEKASKLINSPKPKEAEEYNKIIMPFIEGKKLSESLEQLDWKNICKQIGNSIAKLHDNNIIHGDLTTSNMIWVERPEQDKAARNQAKEKEQEVKQHSNKSKEIEASLHLKNLTITEKDIDEAEPSKFTSVTKHNSSGLASKEEAIDKEVYPKLYFIDFGLGFTSTKIEDRAVDLHLIKQALEAKHFSIHKEAEKIILENYTSKDKEKVLEQLKKVESRGRYRKNVG